MKKLSFALIGLLTTSVVMANSTGTGPSGANGTNGTSTTGTVGTVGTNDTNPGSSSSSQSSVKQQTRPTRDGGSTNASGAVVTGKETKGTVSDTVSKNKVGKDE